MNVQIRRADPSKESLTDENCYILELANDAGDPDVSIARARVLPRGDDGVAPRQKHRRALRHRPRHGEGGVGDLPAAIVSEGDVVRIPANTPQRITNGDDDDLIFFAICTPRFVQSAYVSGR
jgi:hypothetical protein